MRLVVPAALVVSSSAATAAIGNRPARAAAPGRARVAASPTRAVPVTPAWTVCGFRRDLSGTEIAQVQTSRMTCSQAAVALARAHVLLTPGGPVFADAGFVCVARNLEPVTPAPSQLPALVRCSARHHRVIRFIWTWR